MLSAIRRPLPGIALCLAVALVALAAAALETRLFGRAWIDAVILAILVGATVRAFWTPPEALQPGIGASQKALLEIAIVLFGLSVSVATLVRTGPALMVGIAATVVLGIAASYAIGRGFGLRHKLAMLIACGNAICGNTAIVAVAPTIDADNDDVAAAIGFTAVLGILVVLAMPLVVALIGLSQMQSGILAGLTVYSVSQVFAATAPIGPLAAQVGMLVKLARMLMLGPVIFALSLSRRNTEGVGRIGLNSLAPWFLIGFVAMIGLRSTGFVPPQAIDIAARVADVLIVIAMAALGLTVDMRVVAKAGGRATSVVALSLAVLGAISLAVVFLLAH